MKITDRCYNGYKYNSVYKITEMRDNCIFKTAFIGYAKTTDIEKYCLSSLSTKLLKGTNFTIDLIDHAKA